MADIYQSVTELIGHTPLLAAKSFARTHDLHANLLVKLEYFNPAGSVKDRIAIAMIEQEDCAGGDAERADQRQHGYRYRLGCSGARLSCHSDNARDDERRASKSAQGLRR